MYKVDILFTNKPTFISPSHTMTLMTVFEILNLLSTFCGEWSTVFFDKMSEIMHSQTKKVRPGYYYRREQILLVLEHPYT